MADVKQGFSGEPEVFRPVDADAAGRALRRGELRRLARGLYTWNLDEPPEQLLRRRWVDVAALYFPRAVLVGRSAVEAKPAVDGGLFLDSGPKPAHPNAVRLPGLALKPSAGPGPIEGDMRFGSLYRSGEARTALENMRSSRARTGIARTLTGAELEEWLERIARNRGEEDLQRIRDEAREIAPALSAEVEQRQLDELISALLGTGDARLVTEPGSARGSRQPFDADRVGLFETLRGALASHVATLRPEPPDPERVFAFFEAYFSNLHRGHRVRLLNRRILEDRPDRAPGEWKQRPNCAGGTRFVAPDLVRGTPARGLALSTRPCRRAFPARSSPCSPSARSTRSPTATVASPAPCSTPS